MAIFSAIGAAAAATFAWVGTTLAAGGIGATLLNLGIGIAANSLARALAGKPDEPKAAGIVGTMQQGADVPRSFILGRYATSGSLVYHNQWGEEGDTPNAFYTRVTALSDIPIRNVVEVWIDGQRCTLGTTEDPMGRGFPIVEFSESETRTRVRATTKDGRRVVESYQAVTGNVYAWLKVYRGDQTQADEFLRARVASADRPWGTERVGRGVAYAILTCRFDREKWQGLPRVTYVVDGAELWDPSTGETGTGDDLPAVQIRSILRGIRWEGQWLYGPQVETLRIDNAEWAAEVEKCREPVPGANAMPSDAKLEAFGSTTVPARYRAGLEVFVSTPVADTIEALLSACNGRLLPLSARYRMQVGDPSGAVFAFDDALIRSTHPQSFSPFLPLAETVNAVTATYPEPAEAWQTQDAPPLYTAAYEEEDGSRRLTTTAQLPAVPYREQVQRLMKAALEEARRARRHTLVLPAEFSGVEPGDYGAWTSKRNGYDGKLMRVDGVSLLRDGDVAVDFTEVDPSDYDWRPDVEYRPVPRGSITTGKPPAQPIPGWGLEGVMVPDGTGKPRRAALLMQWTPVKDVRSISYQIRTSGGRVLVSMGSITDVEAGAFVVSDGILSDTRYEAQGLAIPISRRPTARTHWAQAMTPLVEGDGLDPAVWDALARDARAQAEAVLAAYEDTRALFELGDIVGEFGRRKEIEDMTADVHRQITERVTADGRAEAAERFEISTRVGDAVAAVTSVREALVTETTALAREITLLEAEVDTKIATASQELLTEVTENSVLAQQVTQLDAVVNGAGASATDGLVARMDVVDGGPVPSAGKLTVLTSALGSTSTQIAQSIRTQSGTSAAYGLTVNNNGHASGFGLISNFVNGAPTAAFTVVADKFYVAAPNGSVRELPFAVVTSPQTIDGVAVEPGVYADRAIIREAQVGRLQLKGESVTIPRRSFASGTVAVSTSWVEVASRSISRITGHETDIGFSCQYDGPYLAGNTAGYLSFRLLRDGVEIQRFPTGGALYQTSHSYERTDFDTTGGTVTYTVEARCQDGGDTANVYQRYLRAWQFTR